MAGNDRKEHYKNLQKIKTLTSQINEMQEQSAALTEKETKVLKKKTAEHGKLKKIIKASNNERIQDALDFRGSEEESIKSLGSMYDNLGKSQRETMSKTAGKFDETSTGWLKKTSEIGKVNRDIAKLDKTDTEQLTQLQNKRNDLMAGTQFLGKDIQNDLKAQNAEADKFASMSENSKKVLEAQHAVLDGIKTAIQTAVESAIQLYGNFTGAVGGIISGFGFVAEKIGQANSELGTTMFQTDGVARKAGVLSFFFEDAVQNAKDLSAELGDTAKASFELQANIGLMSMNMGISGTEATKLVGALSRLNGGSTAVASDMVATSKEFAKQNGIIPAQLMGDLANSTEEFALFGKDGGENILRAAGYAAKLGTNMATLSGIADGLLDFESSITKELELGAMLGKNINLNKARELAYSGDIEGATKETLKQLGGIDAFNKMDYYQKKQTADLLGVSVAELQKMNQNMNNADQLGSVLNEKFSAAGEILNGGLNKYLGTGLKGIGGMVTAAGQMNTGLGAMGTSMGGIVKSSAQVVKNFAKMVASKIGSKLGGAGAGVKSVASGIGDKIKDSSLAKKAGSFKDKLFAGVGDKVKPSKGGGGMGDKLTGKKSIMGGLGKINMSAVLKGAAAMVIVAGAVFVFGKAVQEFMKVSWSAVGMAVVSMLALVGAVALLGAIMMSGVGAVAILAGAAAMLIVAAAVLVLGLGLQAIGTGFEMLGTGIMSLTPNLLAVGASIMGIASLIPIIGIVSLALFTLAGSLAYLSVFGTLALPALMGLGIAFMMAGVGVKLMGDGLATAIGAMTQAETSITRLASMVTPLAQLSLVLFGLSAAMMGLGASMAFLGIMGLPGLMMLAGIAAISGPIITLAGMLGIGEGGEAGAVEDVSLSEYETTMLDKMDQLIQATSSQRDIYLDKDKVTNVVMDRGERSAVNKFKLNRA
jgi:hypothetical protein